MRVVPLLKELQPDSDPQRRIGLVSLVHEADFCNLHVTDRGGIDDPGNHETWRLYDGDTGDEFTSRSAGGGGGISGDPPRRYFRSEVHFECLRLPAKLGMQTLSGTVDEVVLLDLATPAPSADRRFVDTTPARQSRDEVARLMATGGCHDAVPESIAPLEGIALNVGLGSFKPVFVETWRGSEEIWFRVSGDSPEIFGRPELSDPWSDLGIAMVGSDGTIRRGLMTGGGTGPGGSMMLVMTYLTAAIPPG